jgi:hypothetical protein
VTEKRFEALISEPDGWMRFSLLQPGGKDSGQSADPPTRQLYAAVTGVAGGEHLSTAQQGVLEAERGLAQLRQARTERQLVVESGNALVEGANFYDHEAIAPFFELLVGEAGGAKPLNAADLEVREVVGVVDNT